jgi:hypothetical protein
LSAIGQPDRKLYLKNRGNTPGEVFNASTLIKFMYGDILEALFLYLAKEAGHRVTSEQETVEVNGVKGHLDACIDDVVTDVKSASSYSFQKFKDGSLRENDGFGYMDQLAGYSEAKGGLPGAFLAIDKTLGHITLMQVDAEELAAYKISDRIDHLREVLKSDEVPEICYEPKPDGKSGNMILDTGCSYCEFKHYCFKDTNGGVGLRTFIYSTGPRFFTKVEVEPKVPEVTF